MNPSPTDDQRALAEKIYRRGAGPFINTPPDSHDVVFIAECAALLAESEQAAIQKALSRMDDEELKPCMALVDELHSKIRGWASALSEHYHWDWMRNVMLASLPKQPKVKTP